MPDAGYRMPDAGCLLFVACKSIHFYLSMNFMYVYKQNLTKMKNLTPFLIVLFMFAIIFNSCKKDESEDVNVPSISISSPLQGSIYSVFDTVIVTATVSGKNLISSLVMSIIDERGIQVGEAVSTNPGEASFTETAALIISESGVAGGDYKVVVKASDGKQMGIASVIINIIAIPKRYRGLLVISQQNTLKTIVSHLDSLNDLKVVKNLNYAYSTSTLSSYWQQLLFSTPSPSTLYSYRLKNFNIEWQYTPPAPYPELPVLYSDYSKLYAGVGNGTFVEFNSAGVPQVVSPPDLNRIPKKIFRFNDYILMDNAKRNDTKHVLTSSYAVSGALFSEREIDFKVIGFAAISKDVVAIFANKNGQAIIKLYNVVDDQLDDGVAVPLGSFYDMISIDNSRILVSHDNGILLYQSSIDQLSIYIPAHSVKMMEFNSIDNIIYAAKDTVITLYNYNTGGIIDFVISPYVIKDMHVYYNR